MSCSTTRACWAHTDAASGWAKIVRTKVATMVWAERGTRVSRLRMKWVRHRCQVAPVSVERMASTRPGWASEITSVVPARPRATRPRRNANQPAPSSVVMTSKPSTSRWSSFTGRRGSSNQPG